MALDKLVDSTALDEGLTDIADAIRAKGGTSGQLTFPEGFVDAIDDIPTGSGGSAAIKNDVTFYDYDGTIVASYSASEFASLSALPANPSHAGLIAQGWNWSLSDAKTHVAKYSELNIGQMYVTQSGATEIDVEMHELRLDPILTICVNGSITVDWGDNTTPDTVTGTSTSIRLEVPHTYASEGNYTISILATGNNKYGFYGSTSYLILRKNTNQNENRVYANSVKRVRIGNNAEIKDYAFNSCYSLSSIAIPNGITSIGSNAFVSCYKLSSITFPDGITSIGGQMFSSCYSLSSVIIPDGITGIGYQAFYYCYSLLSITIPDDVTSIGNNAFNYCYSLSSITIPDNVTSIGNTAFGSCVSLSSITIPDSVTSVGGSTFSYCYSLPSITIPDSVTSIGASAFQNCNGVKEYHILPTAVPTGGATMFFGMSSDAVIYVPKGHLNDYQTATNWSTYASYMQEEPT